MRRILAQRILILSAFLKYPVLGFLPSLNSRPHHGYVTKSTSSLQSSVVDTEALSDKLTTSFAACQSDLAKVCKVKISPSETGRLGLFATQSISKGDVMLAMPYDDRYVLSGELAKTTVFGDVLPESYDSWTGDAGLVALLVLNEVVRAAASEDDTTSSGSGSGKAAGSAVPKRDVALDRFMKEWASALPSPSELNHPLLWSEDDQEVLQSSSTNKIYRLLDDIEDDATWLIEHVFKKDRKRFPEKVLLNGNEIDCFTVQGFKWAMALTQSRSFFVGGALRLMPFLDMCNHGDGGEEVMGGTMGTFGTTKGAKLVANEKYAPGDEVFCAYGPKSAADYLLEHGFCPESCWKTAVSELTFELDPNDRFYDDKLDILEFETYDQAPMDPSQSFDVISATGRDGDPDNAMIQFVRLIKLGGMDAFLLESIFRKDVWGFMEYPVSEPNELLVVSTVTEACQRALEDLKACPEGGPEVCTRVRKSEIKALERTMEYMQREKEALDLKEYYQERRLKDLGLDSEWAPEDDIADPDLSFGQTRQPGGADYDW